MSSASASSLACSGPAPSKATSTMPQESATPVTRATLDGRRRSAALRGGLLPRPARRVSRRRRRPCVRRGSAVGLAACRRHASTSARRRRRGLRRRRSTCLPCRRQWRPPHLPRAAAIGAAPTTPAAASERRAKAACAAASSSEASRPKTASRAAPQPFPAVDARQQAEVSAENRPEVGIGSSRGGALVLTELGATSCEATTCASGCRRRSSAATARSCSGCRRHGAGRPQSTRRPPGRERAEIERLDDSVRAS
jgi:hypothetical protein